MARYEKHNALYVHPTIIVLHAADGVQYTLFLKSPQKICGRYRWFERIRNWLDLSGLHKYPIKVVVCKS